MTTVEIWLLVGLGANLLFSLFLFFSSCQLAWLFNEVDDDAELAYQKAVQLEDVCATHHRQQEARLLQA